MAELSHAKFILTFKTKKALETSDSDVCKRTMKIQSELSPWQQWDGHQQQGYLFSLWHVYVWWLLFHLTEGMSKKKLSSTTFITKSLQYTSYSCIICGFITNLISFLRMFDGFCYFVTFLCSIMFAAHVVLLGFYQLSRLYYCFSKNQVYSNKGYATWIFIVMSSSVF